MPQRCVDIKGGMYHQFIKYLSEINIRKIDWQKSLRESSSLGFFESRKFRHIDTYFP